MEFNYIIKTNKSSLKTTNHDYKELIEKCILEIEDKLIINPEIIVYGKKCNQHRNVAFFSNTSIGYHYSNQLAKSIKLTKNLEILLNNINQKFNSDFNGILINKYKDGCDSIGPHSDDEKNLGNIGVLSISYGSTRNFRIRDKTTKKIICNLNTNDEEIIIMDGNFQKEFLHEIPAQKKIKQPRYSFTFRKHLK